MRINSRAEVERRMSNAVFDHEGRIREGAQHRWLAALRLNRGKGLGKGQLLRSVFESLDRLSPPGEVTGTGRGTATPSYHRVTQ